MAPPDPRPLPLDRRPGDAGDGPGDDTHRPLHPQSRWGGVCPPCGLRQPSPTGERGAHAWIDPRP